MNSPPPHHLCINPDYHLGIVIACTTQHHYIIRGNCKLKVKTVHVSWIPCLSWTRFTVASAKNTFYCQWEVRVGQKYSPPNELFECLYEEICLQCS